MGDNAGVVCQRASGASDGNADTIIRALIDARWIALLRALTAPAAARDALPEDMVYLRDVDASIVQDMRYAGADNFVGRPLPGYGAPECVLRREVADALARVQADLARAHDPEKWAPVFGKDHAPERLTESLDCYRRGARSPPWCAGLTMAPLPVPANASIRRWRSARCSPPATSRRNRRIHRHSHRSHAGAAAGGGCSAVRPGGALRPLHRTGGAARAR
jgi:hypothetical protein